MVLRLHEATQLKIEDLTYKRGFTMINFIGKGAKARCEPVPVPIMEALNRCIDGRTEGNILLNSLGQPLTDGTAYYWVKQVAVAAGLDPKEVQPHGFRRSGITLSLQQGASLHRVQKMAGHSNPATTMRYDRAETVEDNANHQLAGLLAAMEQSA